MITTLDIRRDYPAPEYPACPLPEDLRNGIVVRMPNHLGDAMMALPALMQIKKMLSAELGLFVIAPASQKTLYAALPFVDGFAGLQKPHKMWSLGELYSLRKMRCGAGILFNNSFRDALCMRIAGVPALFGSDRRMRKLVLTKVFEYPPRPKNRAAEIHQGNRLLQMVYALGAPQWDGKLPEFIISKNIDDCSTEAASCCRHDKLMTIAPGAAYGAAKRWPDSYFKEVAKLWIGSGGIVAIVGTPDEKGIAELVASGLDKDKCFDLCGRTPFDELMILLKSSRTVLANDSGIMHLGAALGTAGVAVFGPTDHTATGPISAKWRLVCTEEKCGPCFKRVCPANNPVCMKSILPAEVFEAVKETVY